MAIFLFILPGAPVLAQEGDASALVSFAYGVRAFNEGHDQQALDEFAKVVALQPRNGTARYWLGLALLRLGRADEAVAEIRRGLNESATLQVDLLWARQDLGAAQLAAGDVAAAESTLAAVARDVEARLARSQDDETLLRQILQRAEGGAEDSGLSRKAAEGSREVRRLERRLAELEARRSAGKASEEDLADEINEIAAEAESRLEERHSDEKLLGRTLLHRSEALERLGRPAEAQSAREQAKGLAPDLAASTIEAPPWSGDLPVLGAPARSWDASVGLGMLGDSNPSLLPENLSLDTPDAGIRLVRGGESDQAAQLNLQLGLHPLHGFRGWNLGAAFEGRQSSYQDLGFFNTGELQAVVYAARGGAPLGSLYGPLGSVRVERDAERRLSLLFQGGVDYTTLDGSGYLTTAEGSASLVHRPSQRRVSQMDLHVLNRSYNEEPVVGRRSGTEVRLGLSETFLLGTQERWWRLEVLGGKRSAGLPFESSLLRGTIEAALPLPGDFAVSLLGSWQKDDYSSTKSDLFFFPYDPFDPEFHPLSEKPTQREDTTLRAAASLSWRVRPGLQLLSRLAWVDRDSNLENSFITLDYRRTIVSLGASWLF
ncbi:MAG: tetratricopeptide repeat protein [Acidobacteriota bacterium]